MKTLLQKRNLYIAVTALLSVIGLGVAADVRTTHAAVADMRVKPIASPTPEPSPISPVLMASAETHDHGQSAETARNESPFVFDPTGDYSLDFEKLPKAFADIEYFTLQVREYYEENGEFRDRPIVPKGAIYAKKEFKLSRIAMMGREITFTTRTVNGVSYRFVGQFPNLENYTGEEEPAALVGKLIKIKNGKWAAAIEAKFYLQHGC